VGLLSLEDVGEFKGGQHKCQVTLNCVNNSQYINSYRD
jgi:hypothetical protein